MTVLLKKWIRYFIRLGILGSVLFSINYIEASENCSKIFSEDKIDFGPYLPKVVRIVSYGIKRIDTYRIMDILNFMNQDIESKFEVSSIVNRLNELKYVKPMDFQNSISLIQMLLLMDGRLSGGEVILAKYLGVSESQIPNIRYMLDVIGVDLRTTMTICSATVISHNVLLTAAHCVQQKNIVKVELDDGRELSSSSIFTSVASIGSRYKFNYDIALVVFPNHSFSRISPLNLAGSSFSQIKGGVIGIDEEKQKKYLNIQANRQGLMFCSYCDDEEQLRFGYSGGPLIDQKGQVLGVTSSSVKYQGKNSVDVFSSVVDGYNRAFLEEVAKEQGVLIDRTW